jgi:hypothetical protein
LVYWHVYQNEHIAVDTRRNCLSVMPEAWNCAGALGITSMEIPYGPSGHWHRSRVAMSQVPLSVWWAKILHCIID